MFNIVLFKSDWQKNWVMRLFLSYSAGRLPYATALNVFDYIDKDVDYLPWKAAIDGINYIPSVLTKTRPAQKKISVRLKFL